MQPNPMKLTQGLGYAMRDSAADRNDAIRSANLENLA